MGSLKIPTRYKLAVMFTVGGVAAAVVAAAYALGTSPFSNTVPRATEYPNASAPVAAMTTLPPVDNPAPALAAAVRRMTADTNGDPDLAITSLRELRTGLGLGAASLYAFEHPNGAVCLVLWKRAGTCPTASDASLPGVEWLVAGGYPTMVAGSHVEVPSAFVAIVDARVRSISLVSGDSQRVLPIVNNAAFVELTPPPNNQPWDARVEVVYGDGSHSSTALPDP
jgi:hypothetical protein